MSDIDIWWEMEGKLSATNAIFTKNESRLKNVLDLCRVAWENGGYKAQEQIAELEAQREIDNHSILEASKFIKELNDLQKKQFSKIAGLQIELLNNYRF